MAAASAPTAELPVLHPFAEIAKTYGFSGRSMRESANRGEFEHVRVGNSLYLTPDQLKAYLQLKTRKPQSVPAQRGSRTRARIGRERARRVTT